MAKHNELGKWGEDVAAAFLQQKGFRIVERNWKCGHKEIDLIVTDEQLLLFVEVKTRRNDFFGDPAEAVGWRTAEHLLNAMEQYICTNQIDMSVRFDILSVTGSPSSYQIELLENAVSNF